MAQASWICQLCTRYRTKEKEAKSCGCPVSGCALDSKSMDWILFKPGKPCPWLKTPGVWPLPTLLYPEVSVCCFLLANNGHSDI